MPGFSQTLSTYLDELKSLREKNASEDMIRAAFLRFLANAFPDVRAEEINLEKRIQLPAYSAGARIQHGFMDAVYGYLIFEFKRSLDKASQAKGEDEIEKYIVALDDPERHFGLLTDGENVRVYAWRDSKLDRLDQFVLTKDQADDAHLRLDTYLFQAKNIKPTARDIALRFGERSPVFWGSYRVLRSLWSKISKSAASFTKFTQWQNLLAVVYGSPIGDEELFLRHTYLVYFARLLAFTTIERRVPSNDESEAILTGEAFANMGFPDFVADDFFAWVAAPELRREMNDWLSGIAVRLGASYDLSKIDEDLLKALYQELVDPITRHDLGEFYTPDWLAELTLEAAGYPALDEKDRPHTDERNSLLDPACGSGTFLFIAIRRLRKAGLRGKALIEFIQQHLAGLDVHPLAVVIAKSNLLLAIGDDLRQARKALRLPVYMANALQLAERAPIPFVRVAVDVTNLSRLTGKNSSNNLPENFHLPFDAESESDYLDSAIDALIHYSNPTLDEEASRQGFESKLSSLIADEIKFRQQWSYWFSNFRLMRWLLREPATDSVWRFILQNAFRPQLLSHRRFSYVAGNPPWLAYRYIQSHAFQDTVRELVFQHSLAEKGKANLFTQMDTSTLFYAFALWNYAVTKGTLAFVMPRSVLTGAKQHRVFQERYLQRANLILDFKGVAPLFPVPTCVVVAQAEDRKRKTIPTQLFEGDLPSHNLSWEIAAKHLKERKERFHLLEAGQPSPYLPQIINGANLYPRSFWFVRVPTIAKVIDHYRPILETDPAIEKQAKPPWKGLIVRGAVESNFLYATLLSDNLLPFGTLAFSLVVLPLKNQVMLSQTDAVRQAHRDLAEWIRHAQNLWKKHRKSEVDLLEYVDWQGKITRQRTRGGYRVICNKSGTYVTACVMSVPKDSDWEVNRLPVQGFVADNTTFYYDTDSADEAYYLAAYLNAPATDLAIKPYQSEGAFGAQSGGGQRDICRRPFEVLPWPRYNPKDKFHRRLASLGRKARDLVSDWLSTASEKDRSMPTGKLRSRLRVEVLSDLLKQIDELVIAILSEANTSASSSSSHTPTTRSLFERSDED
jgi:hypothetical protein